MGKITFFLTLSLIIAAGAYGITGGFGGYYLPGIPIGEAKVTEGTLSAMGGSTTLDVDMTDGYPFKMGPANFAIGGVVYFVPMFGVEGGLEMHTGYKNSEATIKGTITVEGEAEPFGYIQREDTITWKMNNLYAGGRYTYPMAVGLNPVGCGGLLISMSKIEVDTDTGSLTASGSHFGVYVGGGINYFVTPKVAITGLVKYNALFEGSYEFEDYDEFVEIPGAEYEETWKPAPYVTTAFGIEYHI